MERQLSWDTRNRETRETRIRLARPVIYIFSAANSSSRKSNFTQRLRLNLASLAFPAHGVRFSIDALPWNVDCSTNCARIWRDRIEFSW